MTLNLKEMKNPDALCPPTAQFAVRMAPVLANIMAITKGKKFKSFFEVLGNGRYYHLALLKAGIRFSGASIFYKEPFTG